MITCFVSNGIYEGCILVQNREIEDRQVTELIQMGLTLTKIDIMIHEIRTVRSDLVDHAQMYKILEETDAGNIMKNGTVWRSRAMKTLQVTFMEVMQASKILEAYENHCTVLNNFIIMNQKNENQEYVGIGWVETFEKCVKIKTKLTKKDCNHIQQRIEIFQTKTKILKECKESEHLGNV